jgi:hypothetical protein
MPGEDMPTVLDAERALEETLHQVAPSAEDDYYKAEADVPYRGKRKEERGRRYAQRQIQRQIQMIMLRQILRQFLRLILL